MYTTKTLPESLRRNPTGNLWKILETIANRIIKEKQPFQQLIVPKADLLEMFKYNKDKVHFIQEKAPAGTSATLYHCDPLTDLRLGPHVPNTGRSKAFAIIKVWKKSS